MQSKEEIILEVFREHSFEAAVVGACTVIVPEDEWRLVAEQILSLPELKDEPQPQFPQAPTRYAPLPPYDGELLKRLWMERNPQHETNCDTGEDMFWRTAFMVMTDYMQLAGGNGA